MLDTNIVSNLLRHPKGPVFEVVRRVGQEAVCLSIVTAAELRYGCERRASPRLTAAVETLLEMIAVEPFGPPADRRYGALRAHLAAAGTPIGANDLLIAAQALSLGTVLVTHNMREFARVPGLDLEDWIADA
jgi:tRNA(fMet)-specific endonuclease VapC